MARDCAQRHGEGLRSAWEGLPSAMGEGLRSATGEGLPSAMGEGLRSATGRDWVAQWVLGGPEGPARRSLRTRSHQVIENCSGYGGRTTGASAAHPLLRCSATTVV
jgi:hypothetical protein